MCRIKNTTFRDFRASRTDKHTYHRTRNACLRAIWKATQDHWNTVVENTNPSSLWQTVRKALPKPLASLATVNGATCFEDKAQVLRQAFFPDNDPPPQHQITNSLEGFYLVTQEEVLKALEAIQPNSVLRTLARTLGGDLVLRARVVPGIGTSVGSEEGLRVA